MDPIPLIASLGVGLWLAGCLAAAGLTLIRRKRGLLPPAESGFFAAGLVFLGVAPAMSLLVSVLGDSPSIWGGSVQVLVAVVFFAAAARARQRRRNPRAEQSPTTFREKSAALTLVTIAVVFAGYFARSWNAPLVEAVPAFIGATVVIVAIMVIGHIAIALFHAPLAEVDDERRSRSESRSAERA